MSVGFLSLQFPDLGLSGAVILSQAAHVQVDMNFPGRFDRQLVWVELLLYQGTEMKLRALQYQRRERMQAGRLHISRGPGNCLPGTRWAAEHGSLITSFLWPYYYHWRIWELQRVCENWALLHLLSPESPGSRKHHRLSILDFVECWKEHRFWWAQLLQHHW